MCQQLMSFVEPQASTSTTRVAPIAELFIKKEYFKFNAAHFVVTASSREKLHGHSYTAAVRKLGDVTTRKQWGCTLQRTRRHRALRLSVCNATGQDSRRGW